MQRRLYFLLPDSSHAIRLVNDLGPLDIAWSDMHTIANEGIDITGLPSANARQRNDTGNKLENELWDADIVSFFIALFALLLLSLQQAPGWTLMIPIAIMAVTFALGLYFTQHIPNVHLKEFRNALRHQEILLMVDVNKSRVHQIEHWVQKHHPEAVTGGVGWTSTALRI